MPAKIPAAVEKFMATHGVGKDEIWCVHNTTWVVKHKALERAATQSGIIFDRPAMIETNSTDGIVAIVVFGKLGERTEWSIGEASPKNNKNAYPYAMAEKRAKDRVILKLLNSEGTLLYSSADDFEVDNENESRQNPPAEPKRQNPHVTRAEDIFDPSADNDIEPQSIEVDALSKAKAKALWAELQESLWRCGSVEEMKAWNELNKPQLDLLPNDWFLMLKGVYAEHKKEIIKLQSGDAERMAG